MFFTKYLNDYILFFNYIRNYIVKNYNYSSSKLKEETEKLQILTNNTFTFNDEDNVATFNKREILLNIPKSKLYELAKHYKIQKYKKLAKWCLASLLLKQSGIDTMLYKVVSRDRVVKDAS